MANKKLTQAQLRRMEALIAQRNAAQVELDGFVAYLRDEHAAAEGEWTLYNIRDGFVQSGKVAEENAGAASE